MNYGVMMFSDFIVEEFVVWYLGYVWLLSEEREKWKARGGETFETLSVEYLSEEFDW